MNNTTIIATANLTDRQWAEGLDGVYLSEEGWHIRQEGRESGPWEDRQWAEKAAPEFFQA